MALPDTEKDYFDLIFFQLPHKTAGGLAVIAFVTWIVVKIFFTVPIPGDWNESATYKTKMYINLFQDKNYSKNYRVVGDIERISDCDEDYGCAGGYYLYTASFPTTGSIEFDDCSLTLNKKESCRDLDGHDWYVELTNQPAK